ncbi:MAG: polyisoprenoid-binding protein [Gammaproteobacteria bacterium]|nr:polyisoprenoid-binding protein [Gammaproteobacteria bacterium]
MKKSLAVWVMLASSWLGLTTAAQAAPETYVFDKSHTRIFFDVNHLGFSQYRGMFHEYDGTFVFDAKNLAKSKVDVTIQMTSADMYHDKMNEHLKADDILDVAKYPTAHFVSTAVEKTDKGAKVTGNLTLHGVTKSVILDVTFNEAKPHPMNKQFTRGFTALTVLDRGEFGIGYAVPMVSKEVNLYISVEAQRTPATGKK